MEKKESKIKFILATIILPLAFSIAFFACSSPDKDSVTDLSIDEITTKTKLEEKGIIITEVGEDEIIETEGQFDELSDVFTVVEEMPKYPGGTNELYKFLGANIKYPQLAKDNGIEGRVFVNFVVEKDGEISNIKILRGIGSGCDDEAIRVIGLMPKWTPGKQHGKNVRVSYNLPIKYSLK